MRIRPARTPPAVAATTTTCAATHRVNVVRVGHGPLVLKFTQHLLTRQQGNCTSNCDAKAECGMYGKPGQQSCPLDVCCSKFGCVTPRAASTPAPWKHGTLTAQQVLRVYRRLLRKRLSEGLRRLRKGEASWVFWQLGSQAGYRILRVLGRDSEVPAGAPRRLELERLHPHQLCLCILRSELLPDCAYG